MNDKNAIIFLKLIRAHLGILRLKGNTSLEILLYTASRGGHCFLKDLMDDLRVTPKSTRTHLQFLESDEMIRLKDDSEDQRRKLVQITDTGFQKLTILENEIQNLIRGMGDNSVPGE